VQRLSHPRTHELSEAHNTDDVNNLVLPDQQAGEHLDLMDMWKEKASVKAMLTKVADELKGRQNEKDLMRGWDMIQGEHRKRDIPRGWNKQGNAKLKTSSGSNMNIAPEQWKTCYLVQWNEKGDPVQRFGSLERTGNEVFRLRFAAATQMPVIQIETNAHQDFRGKIYVSIFANCLDRMHEVPIRICNGAGGQFGNQSFREAVCQKLSKEGEPFYKWTKEGMMTETRMQFLRSGLDCNGLRPQFIITGDISAKDKLVL
jgi:hypothetical protein